MGCHFQQVNAQVLYSLSFIFNVVLLILIIVHFRRKVLLNQQQARSSKNWFSMTYAVVAVITAAFGYEWFALVYEFYGVSIDHGPDGIAYLTSGIFNIMIGAAGVIVGRIIIAWNCVE